MDEGDNQEDDFVCHLMLIGWDSTNLEILTLNALQHVWIYITSFVLNFILQSHHLLTELVDIRANEWLDLGPIVKIVSLWWASKGVDKKTEHPASLVRMLLRLLDSLNLDKDTEVELREGVDHLSFLIDWFSEVLLSNFLNLLLDHLIIQLLLVTLFNRFVIRRSS